MQINPDAIIQAIAAEKFDVPLMENNWRGQYVEQLVLLALGAGFRHVGGDWAGWDIEQDTGLRIEVKQSAALQSWTGDRIPYRGQYGIAAHKGRWEGATWIEEAGRSADVYVFGWHGVTDPATADHRDPGQWVFHVVGSNQLPMQKTIMRSIVATLAPAIPVEDLRTAVLDCAAHTAGQRPPAGSNEINR